MCAHSSASGSYWRCRIQYVGYDAVLLVNISSWCWQKEMGQRDRPTVTEMRGYVFLCVCVCVLCSCVCVHSFSFCSLLQHNRSFYMVCSNRPPTHTHIVRNDHVCQLDTSWTLNYSAALHMYRTTQKRHVHEPGALAEVKQTCCSRQRHRGMAMTHQLHVFMNYIVSVSTVVGWYD